MHIPPELLPVVQITLPLLVGLFIAAWMQNKRLDDIVARLSAIEKEVRELGQRVARIEGLLTGLTQRVERLEERTPPLIHR
jgi:hypothetical protein